MCTGLMQLIAICLNADDECNLQPDKFTHTEGARYCEDMFDHVFDEDGVCRHVVKGKVRARARATW